MTDLLLFQPAGPRYGRTPIQRVMEKVRVTDSGCWEYMGSRVSAGYGSTRVDGRFTSTHRLVFEHHNGPIPEGLEIDHLCRNKPCCNPAHLEAVTKSENVRRGKAGRSMRWSAEPTCRRGHPYDETNTYFTPDGHRACRTCNNEASRQYKARRRVAA